MMKPAMSLTLVIASAPFVSMQLRSAEQMGVMQHSMLVQFDLDTPPIKTDSVLFAFREVIPGITSESLLLRNRQWGNPVRESRQDDGTTLLEYQIGKWRKVIAVLRDGVVQSVDAFPPENTSPEKLAVVLQLGSLKPVAKLPPEAQLGPAVEKTWKAVTSNIGPGIIFVDVSDGKHRARLLRLFVPSAAPARFRNGDVPTPVRSEQPGKPATPDALSGIWRGTLNEGNNKITCELKLHVTAGQVDGQFQVLASSNRGAEKGVKKLVQGKFDKGKLTFVVLVGEKLGDDDNVHFELEAKDDQLVGTVKEARQDSERLSIEFTRVKVNAK